MKKIGFLSFGHWTPSPHSEVRTASDALLQSIDLAVAAEELGADGAYFRVHHFARQLGSPFPLLAAVGARTRKIEIGTAVIDMRYENPLYMAEDAGAADVIGSWIAPFGLGMNKQIFTFLLVGDRLRGVVCGRCDNPDTTAAIEHVFIVGDTLYFDIVHQDWGESDPPTFDRNIVARVVQNEMIAAILGKNLVVDPANPPPRPAGRGFTLVGPMAPEATRGNSSEGVDVWGPGTGSALQPPPGRTPIRLVNPGR